MKLRIAYWTCQALGWGGYVAMGMSQAAARGGWRPSMVAGYLLFYCYSVALTDLLRREIRRRQWLSSPPRLVFGRMFMAAVTVGTVQTLLVVAVSVALEGGRGDFSESAQILYLWIGVTTATILWTLLYIALTAPRRYREREVSLQLALREAELRALEAQINPHFLFNCLNSIRALVTENPPLAQDMLTRFANILRYNLHRDLNHTVPLASEVEVVTDYLALESVRFEDRLRVQFTIEPETNRLPIPPMLLQTLVENALKHGIATLPEGGDLVIRVALAPGGMIVEVENSGQIAEPKPGSTKMGLANIRERLRILYGERASLQLKNRDGGRVAATVLIPTPA